MLKHQIAYTVTGLVVVALAIASIFLVPKSTNLMVEEHYVVGFDPADAYLQQAWSQAAGDPANQVESKVTVQPDSAFSKQPTTSEETTLSMTEAMKTLPDYGIGIYFEPDPEGIIASDGFPLPKSNIDGYPVITQVTEFGAAARAGITRGTIITSLDGEPAAGLSLFQLATKIRASQATPISIGILGDDEPVDILREPMIVNR